MGETPAELQREIEDLRREATFAVEELEHRLRRVTDVRAQAEEHPYVAGGVLFGLFAGLGFLAYRLIEARREREQPMSRLRRDVALAAGRVKQRAAELTERRQPNMLKRVLWAMLSAGMVALAGLVAKRLTASLWSTTMQEPPPEKVV